MPISLYPKDLNHYSRRMLQKELPFASSPPPESGGGRLSDISYQPVKL